MRRFAAIASLLLVLVAALVFSLLIFVMDFVFGVQNMGNNAFWKGLLGFIYKLIG